MWPFTKRPVIQRSLENPNLPLNDPQVWEGVFGDIFGTDSGVSVTAKKALTVAPWWQAISMVSGDIGRLPIRLYQRTEEFGVESRRQLKESEDFRARLVGMAPNEFFGASQFWTRCLIALLMHGRSVVEVVRRLDGSPSRLILLDPTQTELVVNADFVGFKEKTDAGERFIDAGDALNLEWMGIDETDVLVSYRQARNLLGLAIAQEKYANQFFRNGGRWGGILEFPPGTPKGTIDKITTQFQRWFADPDKSFTTLPLRDGINYKQNSHSPEDSQMIEAIEETARNVARWFNIPPGMLGISGSVSYNTRTEENRAYLDSISRWLCQIEEQLNLKLLSVTEQEDLFFEFDTTALTRLNPNERIDRKLKMIQGMMLSPNEARVDENLPPYAGGNEFANPNTSSGSSDGSTDQADAPADADPVPG